jgi:hypothetical protein
MSLLKLLSAGKSLDGKKPTASPYRMRTANLLPKFGSAKNPFAPAPKSEPSTPEAGKSAAGLETGSLFETEPKAVSAPVRKEPAPKEPELAVAPEKRTEPKPVTAAPVAPAAKEAKPGALAGLVKKLNLLAYLPKRQPGARANRPKTARIAVQGELSLERVRVLRNELNDSDLEFVPVKPAVNMGTAGTMLPAAPRPRLTTWGRLTSRLAGVAETQTQ